MVPCLVRCIGEVLPRKMYATFQRSQTTVRIYRNNLAAIDVKEKQVRTIARINITCKIWWQSIKVF